MGFRVRVMYPNGVEDVLDEVFDTYEEAESAGLEEISCCHAGAEILNMSNPGDYSLDDGDADFDIFEE